MYSPKIADDLIPKLYIRAKGEKKRMTKLVDEIIRDNMNRYEEACEVKVMAVCSSCLAHLETDDNQKEAYCDQCETIVFVKESKVV